MKFELQRSQLDGETPVENMFINTLDGQCQ